MRCADPRYLIRRIYFHFQAVATVLKGESLPLSGGDQLRSTQAQKTSRSKFKLKLNELSRENHHTSPASCRESEVQVMCTRSNVFVENFTIIFRSTIISSSVLSLNKHSSHSLAYLTSSLGSAAASSTSATGRWLVGNEKTLGALGLARRGNNVLTQRSLS